jgi:hypothetical protein
METQEVTEYLQKLPESVTAPFTALTAEQQGKEIFGAMETLGDFYSQDDLTPRIVALQTLFQVEAENEEFGKLKRHGVQSMSTKGTSVNFGNFDGVAPAVIDLLGEPQKKAKGFVGRLI